MDKDRNDPPPLAGLQQPGSFGDAAVDTASTAAEVAEEVRARVESVSVKVAQLKKNLDE